MPDLDEQSLMDMPTTVPRASIAEVQRDLRVRDAIIRGFPEVWQVVGKAGRAETPTDSAPLDMIETVINLRDHDAWPKRKMRFDDVLAQTRAVMTALEVGGHMNPLLSHVERERRANEVAMSVAGQVDEVLRDLASRRLIEFRPELGLALVGVAIDAVMARVDPAAINTKLTVDQRESLIDALSQTYRDRLAVQVTADDVNDLIHEAARRLIDLGEVRDSHDLLAPPPAPLERAAAIAGDVLGLSRRPWSRGCSTNWPPSTSTGCRHASSR